MGRPLSPVVGTEALGEANWLRYQAAPCLLFVGPGTTQDEQQRTLEAARGAGATPVVVSHEEGRLAAVCERSGIQRVRVIGTVTAELTACTAERGLTLLTDPVASELELEMRHYVSEQAISIAYHRHGNLSLRDLQPLLAEALPAEALPAEALPAEPRVAQGKTTT